MSFQIAGRVRDGVISEPSPGSKVSAVFDQYQPIKSYIEAATDYYVTKPNSSFQLKPSDEWIRWNTSWGAAPSSCALRGTMGSLSNLYGFDEGTTWSPSAWNLECPEPGKGFGDVTTPFRGPSRTAFTYSSSAVPPSYSDSNRCIQGCSAKCAGEWATGKDSSECMLKCSDKCLQSSQLQSTSPFFSSSFPDACKSGCQAWCANEVDANDCATSCLSACPPTLTPGDSFSYKIQSPALTDGDCLGSCPSGSGYEECARNCPMTRPWKK